MTDSLVQQNSYSAHPDGTAGAIRLNRRGEIVTNDFIQQAILDGRGFNFANIAPDTLITGSTSYTNSDPCLLVTIAEDTTMIPFYLHIGIEDAGSTDNHITIGFDTADLYVSGGGTAGSTVNNLRSDAPVTSLTTYAKNGATAIVITDPGAGERIIYHHINPFQDEADKLYEINWEPRVCPVLVGPASFFVYVYGASAPTFEYSLQWIEIPTVSVT